MNNFPLDNKFNNVISIFEKTLLKLIEFTKRGFLTCMKKIQICSEAKRWNFKNK
jgi:hypothetical protein